MSIVRATERLLDGLVYAMAAERANPPCDEPKQLSRSCRQRSQFFSLSTSLFAPIHGIMPRSLAPISSIG